MDLATYIVTLLLVPISCALLRGAVWPVIGFLVSYLLEGVAIEMRFISCRPGWEPLASVSAFFMQLPLLAVPWFSVFGLTRVISMLWRRRGR